MYLSRLTLRNFRRFGQDERQLDLALSEGVTALVGRNDCGKSAVIDGIRYALLTRDQSFIRVQPEDFHVDTAGNQADEIFIRCELRNLSSEEQGAFAEYLSYDGSKVSLIVNWAARRVGLSPSERRWVDVSVRSGVNGTGPTFEASARELLASAYLRPLRDAAREMSPGRGSRLSQILANVPEIGQGVPFDEGSPPDSPDAVSQLSLLGLADYLRHSVKNHGGISKAEDSINSQYLSSLLLRKECLRARIDLTDAGNDSFRLRQILERLELGLLEESTAMARGFYGLGSNNILYMACELLLLGREPEGLPLLLIEEPEAHLHPQRQLRLMEFLTKAAAGEVNDSMRPVQVILSTHSSTLASTIALKNLVILDEGRAYPLAPGCTKLAEADYGFLERFLDVTKANLFFAHGVIVVEGDAEALLIPTLARVLGADLTAHGVSVVNVGGTGLRRFSRIFQRSDGSPPVSVPVACVTDMDVMPDCAPAVLGLVTGPEDDKWVSPKRRWKAARDLRTENVTLEQALADRRAYMRASDEQSVRTFISEHWTLEYDLAYCGFAEEVYVAASLAKSDDAICNGTKAVVDVVAAAKVAFEELVRISKGDLAMLCSHVYRLFHSGLASKAIAAQYLASAIAREAESEGFSRVAMMAKLPSYIVDAIDYVTGFRETLATEMDVVGAEDAHV